MRTRTGLTAAALLVGALALAVLASSGAAGSDKSKSKRMSGYLEVPSVSTPARGVIEARINNSTIQYTLTYSALSGTASAAHIHFAQPGVNGGIAAFLCGGGSKPVCPATSGTVQGTIAASDVLEVAGQGIAAGEIGELIAAMRAGLTYANVHSAAFASGEIRGQIKATRDDNDDDD